MDERGPLDRPSDGTREGTVRERELLAQIIEAVLAGAMSSADALIQTQTLEVAASSDRLLADAWEELSHFEADADIRERDAQYSDIQRRYLEQYVTRLRA